VENVIKSAPISVIAETQLIHERLKLSQIRFAQMYWD